MSVKQTIATIKESGIGSSKDGKYDPRAFIGLMMAIPAALVAGVLALNAQVDTLPEVIKPILAMLVPWATFLKTSALSLAPVGTALASFAPKLLVPQSEDPS